MQLDNIVSRFTEFCGLSQEEGEKRRTLCADAMGRVRAMQSGAPGGEGPLEAYAAAMACRRFVLLTLAAGGTLAIGEPVSEEYRRGASPWLLPPEFCFRRTGGAL